MPINLSSLRLPIELSENRTVNADTPEAVSASSPPPPPRLHTESITVPVDEIVSGDTELLHIPGFFLDARIRHKLENMASIVGVNAISERNATERAYNISEGTMLGLRFGEKFHEQDSNYVLDNEIRRVHTARLIGSSQGRAIFWLETGGVMETGFGAQGTVCLGDGVSVAGSFTYGFSAGSVIRYRTSQVFALGLSDSREKLIEKQKIYIPQTAEEAKLMTAGSELEITGQGKVNNDLSLTFRAGPNVAMATAGIGIEAESRSNATGEFSLNVTALDGYRKVRVTIRALDHESTSFAAFLRAGLIFAPGTLQPPFWGGGFLKYLVGPLGYKSIEDFVNAYTAFSARYRHAFSHQGTIIASYDFDLNNPLAAKAYEETVRLSPARAHKLSTAYKSTGVAKVLARESETVSSSLFDLTLLGEKLYLRETLTKDRSGFLEENHKKQMVYEDSIFRQVRKSFFTGKKEVDWQAVSIEDKVTGEKIPYFRFQYKKLEFGVKAEETAAYFRFAQAMGIYASDLSDGVPDHLSDYDKVFAKAEEIETNVEVFFTGEGARLIDAATKREAYDAYLDISIEILLSYRGLPVLGSDLKSFKARDIIREYRNIETGKRPETYKSSQYQRLEQAYLSLTQRSLRIDLKLLKEAEEFAGNVEDLKNVSDHQQAKKFFHKLGKEKGFNFMQTIATLQSLAKPENTLIHSLSRSGGGITLQSEDEGVMEHPREWVMSSLTSASSAVG